jgi:hypothetical protein
MNSILSKFLLEHFKIFLPLKTRLKQGSKSTDAKTDANAYIKAHAFNIDKSQFFSPNFFSKTKFARMNLI